MALRVHKQVAEVDADVAEVTIAQRSQQLRALAQLRAVDSSRHRLIATVAHELRNPLTSIVGHLDLLREGEMSAETSLEVIDLVLRSAERMQTVVDDLMVLASAGELLRPGIRDRLNLADVVDESVRLLQPSAVGAVVELNFVRPDLPVDVPGDFGQLMRVAQNLVINAIKYSLPGAVVRVELGSCGDQVTLVVADQGVGISEADHEHLFDEFFRSQDPSVQCRTGSGLGLSIVQRIVHAHGGSVEIDSELGTGTTCTVTLPRFSAGSAQRE